MRPIPEKSTSIVRALVAFGLIISMLSASAEAARVKDIARIEGAKGIQVIGYGLVTGLKQTGDSPSATFTVQSVSSMLKRFGVSVPQVNLKVRNVAAVMVTATIPSYYKPGSTYDIQVSSMGDARSLQGGILLMTPLSGPDGTVYGLAQGPMTVGGYDLQSNGTQVAKNSVCSGRIPNGGMLERAIPGSLSSDGTLRVQLNDPDFTTARRLADVINATNGLENTATALDPATVVVQLASTEPDDIVTTISTIEQLDVTHDSRARVVINERTGTVVVGGQVSLLPCVIAHGGLEIKVDTQEEVSQPNPFTIAQPERTRNSSISAAEEWSPATVINGTSTVQEMANALNSLNVTPRDLISIFQALKESGALQAELIIQ